MKELTKVFDGVELPIELITEENYMIDVSGVASKYGKNIGEWINGRRVQELLDIKAKRLFKSISLDETEDLKVDFSSFKKSLVQIGIGRYGKSRIHKSMLIPFARFISPEFEDWCDVMIEDILTGTLSDKYQCEMQSALAETRKFNVYVKPDGKYTSARGLIQNSPELSENHDDKSIKELLALKGFIEPYYTQSKKWRVTDKGKTTDMFDLDSHGTILYNIENTEKAVNQLLIAHNLRQIGTMMRISVYNGFTGEFYQQYHSLNEAERQLGVTGISGVLNGNRDKKHIRGMVFRDDEPRDFIEPLKGDDLKKIFRDINVFNDNGILIKRCKTGREAGLIGGNGVTQVGRLLKSGKANSKGYTYAYAELEFAPRR